MLAPPKTEAPDPAGGTGKGMAFLSDDADVWDVFCFTMVPPAPPNTLPGSCEDFAAPANTFEKVVGPVPNTLD